MSSKFKNKKTIEFIKETEKKSLNLIEDKELEKMCKFNFAFFDSEQEYSSNFEDWKDLPELMNKIKDFCKEPLSYWKNKRVGAGGLKVFDIYKDFPKKSEFSHPAHVPSDVWWARFRIGSKERLIGFVIPDHVLKIQQKTELKLDKNTFYVVFLDPKHKFYISE